MAKVVLTTKVDPTYDDLPEERYHFPKAYLRQIETQRLIHDVEVNCRAVTLNTHPHGLPPPLRHLLHRALDHRALPGMPHSKPAGVPCIQLDAALRCKVFGQPERPAFCAGLQPSLEMCGNSREEALAWLSRLEQATRPGV